MQRNRLLFTLTLIGVLFLPAHAYSYVGPGLGAGTIGVILGLLGSVLLALFAFFWYPIKRAIFRKKEDQSEDQVEISDAASETEPNRELEDS